MTSAPTDLFSQTPDLALAARCDTCVLLTARPAVAFKIAREIADRVQPRPTRVDVLDCDVLKGGAMADALCNRRAAAGILLLREVHALSETNQRLLAQLLESRPPGSHSPRILASSSVSLVDCVEQGRFDATLFYRLNTIHIKADDVD